MDSITQDDIISSDKYLSLESDNITYIKTDLLHSNLNSMFWRNKQHYMRSSKIWITGHSDYSIDTNTFNKYQHNCDYWFSINKDSSNPKLFSLPLGITNFTNESHLHPIYGNTQIMIDVMSQPKTITNLIYLNFNINTYPLERQICYDLFYDKPYVTIGNINNTLEGRKLFLQEIRNHKFVLCPRGNGIDTHRLWETLYMGSIPIVKKCIAMNDFNDLPILFINDWSEVNNTEYLEIKYNEIMSHSWNFNKLKFSYWKNIILKYANS
jgi:hypothetical protein